jgi:hypothetical protein
LASIALYIAISFNPYRRLLRYCDAHSDFIDPEHKTNAGHLLLFRTKAIYDLKVIEALNTLVAIIDLFQVSFRFIVLVLHQCHRYQSFVLQIAIC